MSSIRFVKFNKKLILVIVLMISVVSKGYSQFDWKLVNIDNTNAEVNEEAKYLLKEKNSGNVLKYEKQSLGVNLKFGSKSEILSNSFIKIKSKSGSATAIKSGEAVAIGFYGGGYIGYSKRNDGISLDFIRSGEIRYEWILKTNQADGQVLKTNTEIGIFSTGINQYLVPCKQEGRLGLAWLSDCINGKYKKH